MQHNKISFMHKKKTFKTVFKNGFKPEWGSINSTVTRFYLLFKNVTQL